jgi:hypothetical protein
MLNYCRYMPSRGVMTDGRTVYAAIFFELHIHSLS